MMPPKLILVPIDFNASSQEALEVATDMASRPGAALLLVHIVPAIPDLRKTSQSSKRASTTANFIKLLQSNSRTSLPRWKTKT